MKKQLIGGMLVCLSMIMSGCSLINNNWDENKYTPAQIENFSQVGTSIVLAESKMPLDKAMVVQQYINDLQRYLTETEHVDFALFKQFVGNLPPEYQFVGATIMDLIERYVRQAVNNILEEQPKAVIFVSAGLKGAERAINNYIQRLQPEG